RLFFERTGTAVPEKCLAERSVEERGSPPINRLPANTAGAAVGTCEPVFRLMTTGAGHRIVGRQVRIEKQPPPELNPRFGQRVILGFRALAETERHLVEQELGGQRVFRNRRDISGENARSETTDCNHHSPHRISSAVISPGGASDHSPGWSAGKRAIIKIPGSEHSPGWSAAESGETGNHQNTSPGGASDHSPG